MILFKRGSWIVDASIGRKGVLTIISGDGNAEWHIMIEAVHFEHLNQVLIARSGAARANEDPGPDVLQLLHASFGARPDNPFEDIKVLLNKNDIPWKHSFWGSI